MESSRFDQSMYPISALQTIDQLAAKYGVSLRTLRFYEQLEMLKPARAGTRRLYGAKDEVRLQIILKGRRLGFALREIREMLEEIIREAEPSDLVQVLTQAQISEQLKVLEQQRDQITSAIDELRAARR